MDMIATREMLRAAAERVIAAEPELTRADQAIGDGDHGVGMARGFRAALVALDGLDGEADPGAAFSAVGRAVLTNAGGASGAVFGSFFSAAGKSMTGKVIGTVDLAAAFEAGAQAVMARGKAKAGDKTMLDALLPAIETLVAAGADTPGKALGRAAAAAAEGAKATAGMQASTGRAKNLGARSIGHPDPGALSMAFIMHGMAGSTKER